MGWRALEDPLAVGFALLHGDVCGAKVFDAQGIKHAGVDFWKFTGLTACGNFREDAALFVHVGRLEFRARGHEFPCDAHALRFERIAEMEFLAWFDDEPERAEWRDEL